MEKNKLKVIFILLILLFLYIFICANSYVFAISTDLANSVFRLHVLANSDSENDQNLKLQVRDSLLKYMNNLCIDCQSKEEAISIAIKHKSDFQKIAEQTIQDNGYNYKVKININNFYFPTKNYGDISLPAGFYDALRVEIGEAKGKNWWCVMFPSLCFIDVNSGIVDSEAKENLEKNLTSESYNIISDNSNSSKIKFKIIELLSNKDMFTAKNN